METSAAAVKLPLEELQSEMISLLITAAVISRLTTPKLHEKSAFSGNEGSGSDVSLVHIYNQMV